MTLPEDCTCRIDKENITITTGTVPIGELADTIRITLTQTNKLVIASLISDIIAEIKESHLTLGTTGDMIVLTTNSFIASKLTESIGFSFSLDEGVIEVHKPRLIAILNLQPDNITDFKIERSKMSDTYILSKVDTSITVSKGIDLPFAYTMEEFQSQIS